MVKVTEYEQSRPGSGMADSIFAVQLHCGPRTFCQPRRIFGLKKIIWEKIILPPDPACFHHPPPLGTALCHPNFLFDFNYLVSENGGGNGMGAL